MAQYYQSEWYAQNGFVCEEEPRPEGLPSWKSTPRRCYRADAGDSGRYLPSFEEIVAVCGRFDPWAFLPYCVIILIAILTVRLYRSLRVLGVKVSLLEKQNYSLRLQLERFYKRHLIWLDVDAKPESMIRGSNFVLEKPPPFQVKLCTRRDVLDPNEIGIVRDPESFVGYAVILAVEMGNQKAHAIVTAAHNLESCGETVVLYGPVGSTTHDTDSFKRLGEKDIAYRMLSQEDRSALGVAVGRPATWVGSAPASIVARGKMSEGLVRHAANVALVSFNGSTLKGFSGACYYQGKRVFGIHTCGSAALQENFGLAADFVAHAIAKREFVRQEDSYEYYADEVEKFLKQGGEQWSYVDQFKEEVSFRGSRGQILDMDAELFHKLVKDRDIEHRHFSRGGYAGRSENNSVNTFNHVYTQTPCVWEYENSVDCGSSTFERSQPLSLCDAESYREWSDCKRSVGTQTGVLPTVNTSIAVQTVKGVNASVQTKPDMCHGVVQATPITVSRSVQADDLVKESFLGETETGKKSAPALVNMNRHFPDTDVFDLHEMTTMLQAMRRLREEENSASHGHTRIPAQPSEASNYKLIEALQEMRKEVEELRAKKKTPTNSSQKRKKKIQRLEEEVRQLKGQLSGTGSALSSMTSLGDKE